MKTLPAKSTCYLKNERKSFVFLFAAIYINSIMTDTIDNHACSHTYLLIENDDYDHVDIEAARYKNLLKMTIMGPLEDFESNGEQKQEDQAAFLCTCYINIHKATIAINTFAIITNVFTLVILCLAMSTTGFVHFKYMFHGELTGLEMKELGSVFATSIVITIVSIMFGIAALVGIVKSKIWLTVPNLVWLVVGYIMTVVVNLQATATVPNYNYGVENMMFHLFVTCGFLIPNVVYLKDVLKRKLSLVKTKQTSQ